MKSFRRARWLSLAAVLLLLGAGVCSAVGQTKPDEELKPPAEAPAAASEDVKIPPAASDEVVKMESVTIAEKKDVAQNSFTDKIGTETFTEVLTGAALNKPAAQNSSDLLKDTSGVTMGRGADGASKVSVRGIDTRFLRITVDGQRQGGSGNALDSLPPEVVQSLEVTKAFTPDMDSDAVGGVINVSTGGIAIKKGYEQGRHQIVYNTLGPRPGFRNSLTLALPFTLLSVKPDSSFMVTASFDDLYRTRENLRIEREWPSTISPGPAPYVGVAVPVLTKPHLESTLEHRQRSGLIFNADTRVGDTSFYFRSNFNRDWAKRDRKFDDVDPSTGTPVALTPDYGVFTGATQTRRELLQITQRDAASLSTGGKTRVGRFEIDGVVGYTVTKETEPRTLESEFRNDHLFRVSYDLRGDRYRPAFTFVDETAPGNLASSNDPAHYFFDSLGVASSDTQDSEASAKLNVKYAPGASSTTDYLKFGAKLQQRRRDTNVDRVDYIAGSQPRDMNGLVGVPSVSWQTADYHYGALPNSEAVANLLTKTPAVFQEDADMTAVNSNSGDYSATENVWALYGMGKTTFGRWTLLGGARVEGTENRAKGNQVQFATNGSLLGFTHAETVKNYLKMLPGVHLRFDPDGGLIYRASVTRTIARPGFADLVPYRSISFSDRRTRSGNPDLVPYESTNFDLSVDKYSEKLGLITVAFFYKDIGHFLSDATYQVTLGDLGQFTEYKKINGDAAKAMGVETNWQSPAWALPAAIGKASFVANYSYLHGEAHYATRPAEKFPMPEQVNYQGSLSLHLESSRWSADGTVRYRSKWWEDIIAFGFDNYLAGYWDAELSASFKINKTVRVSLGVGNLLDQPQIKYAGLKSRPNDYLQTGVDVNLGMQWKL